MSFKIQQKGCYRAEEAIAGGTVKPGHLLLTNNLGKVVAHNVEGGYAERAFALEDALQGKTVSDSYSNGDRVQFGLFEPGAEIQALVKAGENIAIGDMLISAGDGTLIENGSEDSLTTVEHIVAIAMEAANLTGSGAVDTLVRVRVL